MSALSISVGSVAVDVVPDTRKFAPQLKAKLKGITANIGIEADTAELKAKLDVVTRQRKTTVKVDADTTAAETEIDGASRNRKTKIDVSAAGAGLTAILALGPALVPIVAAVGGLAAAFALPLAAAGGGLTLGAVVAGAAIKQTEKQKKAIDELAKKVAAAKQNLANVQAGGTTLGGGSAAGSTAAAQRGAANSLAAAQRAHAISVASAQAALGRATTTTARAAAEQRIQTANATLASRQAAIQASLSTRSANISASAHSRQAAAQRKVTEATAAYNAAVKGLTPAQARFLKTQQALKDSFKNLVSAAGPAIFGPVIKGMGLLSKIMPSLKGPLTAISGAVGTLLTDLGKAASGPGFKNFMNAFGSLAASSIVSFGRTFGNFAKGLFGLMTAFAPLSKTFVGGLSDMAKRFADWGTNVGKSKGFHDFLAYLQDVGPKVAATIGSVVKAVVRIGIALAPIGGLALGSIKVLADVIGKVPVPVLTALAGGIVAVVLALKAAQIINNGSKALGTLSTTINGFRGADSQLSKTQTAIRGLSGSAGLGALTLGATTSNKKLGILASAGGGALLGFSLGGPIGAAVGAGAGALLGLATQASKTKDAIKRSIPVLGDYVDSLNAVSGAATQATRNDAFTALQASGAIGAGKKFNLSPQTLISATLGDPKALKVYNKAINAYRKERDNFIASGGMGDTSPAAMTEKKHLADLAGAFNTLTDAVGGNSKKLNSDKTIARDRRQGVLNLAAALKGLPAKAITEIGLKGFPPTKLAIAQLATKYKLTPTQIRTLVKVDGIGGSVREIQRLQDELRRLKGKTIPVRLRVTAQQLVNDPSLGKPRWTGVEGAGARGAIINRPTVALIGENGPERLTPLDQTAGNSPLPASGGHTGPLVNIENLTPLNYSDFERTVMARQRLAGLSGGRP